MKFEDDKMHTSHLVLESGEQVLINVKQGEKKREEMLIQILIDTPNKKIIINRHTDRHSIFKDYTLSFKDVGF